MKFDILCLDPPYNFADGLTMSATKRGAASNYTTMSAEELLSLPIKDIANDNALLALWVPSSLLALGVQLMNAYGFTMKQTWIWVKTKKYLESSNDPHDSLAFGLGRLARNCHELVLVGTKGSVYEKLQNKSQRTVFFAPNFGHSKKPEKLQDMLDTMFPNASKLELFARRQRNGWVCCGNENPTTKDEDIKVSIKRLVETPSLGIEKNGA